MRRLLFVLILILIAWNSPADEPQAVPPTHIVAPYYPAIAKTAHITGEVDVQVTIYADGSVGETMAVSGPGLLYRESEDVVHE